MNSTKTPSINDLRIAWELPGRRLFEALTGRADAAERRTQFRQAISKIQQDARDHEASYWRRTCRALENAVAAAHRREDKIRRKYDVAAAGAAGLLRGRGPDALRVAGARVRLDRAGLHPDLVDHQVRATREELIQKIIEAADAEGLVEIETVDLGGGYTDMRARLVVLKPEQQEKTR